MGLTRSKNLSQAKATCDKWFSIYIRLRDSASNGLSKCVTCDTVKHWREMDCGHFQGRRFLGTRYHEHNASAQCQGCNQYGAGEQFKFGNAIDLKFGDGTALEMETLARSLHKKNKNEVMALAREYKDKAEELAKIKGLMI